MEKEINYTVDNQVYTVIVTYKRMRRMYLRVNEAGQVYVSCPLHTSDADVLSFLNKNTQWLLRTLEKVKVRQKILSYGEEGEVLIFGEKWKVTVCTASRNTLEIKDRQLVYRVKDTQAMPLLFNRFSKKMVEEKSAQLRYKMDAWICDEYHVSYPSITVRNMSSRWGSCTPSRATIRLSSRLVHYPTECLEYVLLHEYTHLIVPNHSDRFYEVVARFMPQYKQYEAWLNRR